MTGTSFVSLVELRYFRWRWVAIPAALVFIVACSKVTQVEITLQREGAPTLMTPDAFKAEFADTRGLVASRDAGVINPKKDFFIRLDVSSDQELRHVRGEESKFDPYALELDGYVYLCDKNRETGFRIFAFPNPAPPSTPGYHYAFIDYLPSMWPVLVNPAQDICIDIERKMPDKTAYDSSHYYSNTLRVTAEELNTLYAGLPN